MGRFGGDLRISILVRFPQTSGNSSAKPILPHSPGPYCLPRDGRTTENMITNKKVSSQTEARGSALNTVQHVAQASMSPFRSPEGCIIRRSHSLFHILLHPGILPINFEQGFLHLHGTLGSINYVGTCEDGKRALPSGFHSAL